MRINTNISALQTYNNMTNANARVMGAAKQLSSGQRINSAADDAAGLAIVNKLSAQISGVQQASRNSANGICLLQTADGAFNELQDIVRKIRTLALQSSNDSNTDGDRQKMQAEVEALLGEINSVSTRTDFNGIKLLNGECGRVVKNMTPDAASMPAVSQNPALSEAPALLYTNDKTPLGAISFQYSYCYQDDGGTPPTVTANSVQLMSTFASAGAIDQIPGSTYSVDGSRVTVSGPNGETLYFDLPPTTDIPGGSNFVRVSFDLEPSSLKIQIGADKDMNMTVEIPKVNCQTLGIDKTDISTGAGAQKAISVCDDVIKTLSAINSRIGAGVNRLQYNIANLDVADQSLQISRSGIFDTDMAAAMTEYSTQNVIYQAGVSILAQANQRPQAVLQLLQT